MLVSPELVPQLVKAFEAILEAATITSLFFSTDRRVHEINQIWLKLDERVSLQIVEAGL